MNKRNSNLELLRIVSMVMIVFRHLACHTSYDPNTIFINKLWINFIGIGGKIGVAIFILITGYFMISKENLRVSKLVKLWLQLVFYDILIYIVFLIFGLTNFSIKGMILRFMPITNQEWWFASVYFVMYLFIPYINTLLNRISKESYIKYLIIAFICFSIIPTFTGRTFESNNLVWFIFLYSVGGYIKLYENDFRYRSLECLFCSFIILALTFGLKNILSISKITYLYELGIRIYDLQSFALFSIALFMFIGFKNMKIKDNIYINIIAASSFGVYLIHDNNFIRPYLWGNIVNASRYSNSIYLILYSIIVVFLIYGICSIIEFIRINFVEKKYIDKLNKIILKR